MFAIEMSSGLEFNHEIMVARIADDGLCRHDLLSQGGAEILYSEVAVRFM